MKSVLSLTILELLLALAEPLPVFGQNGTSITSAPATTRKIPSTIEILAPSSVVFCLCLIAVFIYSVIKNYSCTNNVQARRKSEKHVGQFQWEMTVLSEFLHNGEILPSTNVVSPICNEHTRNEKTDTQPPFLTGFDKEMLYDLHYFHNNPRDIMYMCTPSFITLIFGALSMLFYYHITEFFWPVEKYPKLPNINQGVSCFLTPAGLVYAISFGFAFQQAMNKQTEVLQKMMEEISKLDQAATLTSKLKLTSNAVRMKLYRAIKAEAMYMILQVEDKDLKQFRYQPTEDIKVEIWEVLGYLTNIPHQTRHHIDVIMSQNIIDIISKLNSVCSDQIGILHTKIHFLKWLFLVTLGFFSLFGILLIQAFSYRMELIMCTLTLFSIAMLCYIIADLDSPFSGFFRIDVSIIADVVYRLEFMHNMAKMGCSETACYPDSSKFKYKRR